MNFSITRALEAFESALRHAPLSGLRDLHEALQTGQLATPFDGKADLVRGHWGTLGAAPRAVRYSACPLNALYIREAREQHGHLRLAIALLTHFMALDGYLPADFYRTWDAGLLAPLDLRSRVERHIDARLNAGATVDRG